MTVENDISTGEMLQFNPFVPHSLLNYGSSSGNLLQLSSRGRRTFGKGPALPVSLLKIINTKTYFMTERKYFIDWVRVLAFMLLILFHCAMPFVTVGWEIENNQRYEHLTSIVWWFHQWRLPLLFFVSGAGISFSLVRRSVLRFAGERFVRLFIPLVFGMLFTVPLQVYFEWLQEKKIVMSYAEFYPSVWNFVPYPDGSLTWSHLWFVVYLFVFCILLLPVFGVFKIKQWKNLKKHYPSD